MCSSKLSGFVLLRTSDAGYTSWRQSCAGNAGQVSAGAVSDDVERAPWSSIINQEIDESTEIPDGIINQDQWLVQLCSALHASFGCANSKKGPHLDNLIQLVI